MGHVVLPCVIRQEMPLCRLGADAISEHPNFLNFEFDNVTWLEKAQATYNTHINPVVESQTLSDRDIAASP